MKECKYWIVVLLQLCFLSISCGEKGAKQVAPAQDHAFLKFENNEDGKYSQAMIAQIIKHFHLPNNTVVTDEDVDAILLRSVDGGDGIYGGDVVSIWKYYKKQNDIQEIVTAHPMADLLWYNPDKKHGVTIGLDSVFVASEAMLVPLNPDVVVVNGTTDKMNAIYTFIVDKDAGKAILLPSNCGCVGFTSEEGLPICLSFRHHANGEPGRYSVVSVYDKKGNLVKEMSFEDYKKRRSNDSNRIDNLYSAAQESFFSYSCIGLAVGKNCICTFRYARCRNI